MMRLALAAGMLLALTGLAHAQSYDTPEALLAAFYQPYLDDSFGEDDGRFRSQDLQALYDQDAEITPEGEIGTLDFDPFISGQDYAISNLEIGEAEIDGDWATVVVSFDNFERPVTMDYDLVLEDDGWKIDDVAFRDATSPYRLSEIFAAAAGN